MVNDGTDEDQMSKTDGQPSTSLTEEGKEAVPVGNDGGNETEAAHASSQPDPGTDKDASMEDAVKSENENGDRWEHQKLFERKALEASRTTKQLSKDEWNRRVYLLRFWDGGDGKMDQRKFRKHYSIGYKLKSMGFCVQAKAEFDKDYPGVLIDRKDTTDTSPVSDNDQYCIVKMATVGTNTGEKETRPLVVVHQLETYEAIRRVHERLGHSRVTPTLKSIKDLYWNITEEQIKIFVMTCPNCQGKGPNLTVLRRPSEAVTSLVSAAVAAAVASTTMSVQDKSTLEASSAKKNESSVAPSSSAVVPDDLKKDDHDEILRKILRKVTRIERQLLYYKQKDRRRKRKRRRRSSRRSGRKSKLYESSSEDSSDDYISSSDSDESSDDDESIESDLSMDENGSKRKRKRRHRRRKRLKTTSPPISPKNDPAEKSIEDLEEPANNTSVKKDETEREDEKESLQQKEEPKDNVETQENEAKDEMSKESLQVEAV